MPLVGVFGKFYCRKFLAGFRGSEPIEEEAVGGDSEEFVLRLLAKLVHCVADGVKADLGFLQELIVSIVTVGEDEEFKKLDELVAA